jgi:hypothetical protein
MSFLTSICVSDIGSIPQNGLVNISTNVDNYTTPIQTNVAISAMTGNNCPYYLSVPSGTTEIHIDYNNSVRICLSILDPCTDCNLGFDVYNQNSIGQVVVGNLTGSCGTITDYLINWYGPQNNAYDPAFPNQNIAFTSGKGTLFPGYGSYVHPMTGAQSPPMIPGYYVPIISKVKINGTIYSLTGGTGTVETNLNCLYPTVIISAFTCSDTNSTGDYSRVIDFSTTGDANTPPSALSTVLKIDTSVNFLAMKFDGFNIYDTFKVVFSGASYSTPLTLEYISVGFDLPTENFGTSTMPKITSSPSFEKVLCFTGLTRTSNDFLLISIIPNQTNNATSWKISWKCLETFDCSMCIDTYRNNPYKIIGSSITYSTGGCNTFSSSLTLSGCSQQQQDLSYPSRYFMSYDNLTFGSSSNYTTTKTFTPSYSVSSETCYNTNMSIGGFLTCRPDNGNGTITSRKYISGTTNTIDVLEFTFTDINDFNNYYNSYNSIHLSFSGTPNNPTNINYYRYYVMQICAATGNQRCGDNSGWVALTLHPSSVVTTGVTNNIYSLSFTMPRITKQINFTNCQLGCDNKVNEIINSINSFSSFQPFSFTSNVGARFINLFYNGFGLATSTTQQTSYSLNGAYDIIPYSYQTYVYSGGNPTYTFIPNLSATTCNFDQVGRLSNGYRQLSSYYFRVNSPNVNNLNHFEIYCKPVTNWLLGSEVLAYVYSAGTTQYSNPTYII